jgi:uncharacterized membrane protein HdeD (DUF308 family)
MNPEKQGESLALQGGEEVKGGVGLLVWRDPVVGAALVIVLVGVGLVAKGIASSVMEMFGLR